MDIKDNYSLGKMDGFEEAWKLAREIWQHDYTVDVLEKIFGTCELYDIFHLPADTVVTRIEEYKKSIKVGDVVKSNKYVGVVLQKNNNALVRILTKTSTGNVVVAAVPVDETIKLAESVDSFSGMLGKIGYINE